VRGKIVLGRCGFKDYAAGDHHEVSLIHVNIVVVAAVALNTVVLKGSRLHVLGRDGEDVRVGMVVLDRVADSVRTCAWIPATAVAIPIAVSTPITITISVPGNAVTIPIPITISTPIAISIAVSTPITITIAVSTPISVSVSVSPSITVSIPVSRTVPVSVPVSRSVPIAISIPISGAVDTKVGETNESGVARPATGAHTSLTADGTVLAGGLCTGTDRDGHQARKDQTRNRDAKPHESSIHQRASARGAVPRPTNVVEGVRRPSAPFTQSMEM
jgi:hypothetical protein